MAKDDFSFRRFFHFAHAASAAVGIVVGLLAGPAGSPVEMVIRGIGGGVCGLMASGCLYLFLVSKDLKASQIPEEELNESEVVLVKSAGSMVHYKSGRPLRFWEAVGGSLFLTNEVLEFRSHRGQFWLYRLTIPLDEVANAMACKILGMFPGGLRVERRDGRFELFTFGALVNSPNWASAIVEVQSARAFVDGRSFRDK